jgi:hypothetical protein
MVGFERSHVKIRCVHGGFPFHSVRPNGSAQDHLAAARNSVQVVQMDAVVGTQVGVVLNERHIIANTGGVMDRF